MAPEEPQPERPRFLEHLKNLGKVWAALIVAIAGLWLVACLGARHLRGQALAALAVHNLHEHLSAFAPPPIPDEENAAVPILAAARKVSSTVDSPRSSNDEAPGGRVPYPDAWWARADASAQVNAPAFAGLLAATKLKHAQWGFPYSAPPRTRVLTLLPHLNRMRGLANVVQDEALRRHFKGDEPGCFDLVEANLALGHSLDDEPTLIDNLVGAGIHSLAISDLPLIASSLRLSPGTGGVDVARVRSLMDALAALGHPRNLLGWITEGIEFADLIDELGDHVWLIRPVLRARASAQRIQACTLADSIPAHGPIPATVPMANAWLIPPSRFLEILRRHEVDDSVAALALAIALYRADHGGRFPETLTQLVPAYIPAIPLDPFSNPAAPAPLQYRLAEGGHRPIILSAGPDHNMPPPSAPLPPFESYGPVYSRPHPAFYWDLASFPALPAATASRPATP